MDLYVIGTNVLANSSWLVAGPLAEAEAKSALEEAKRGESNRFVDYYLSDEA